MIYAHVLSTDLSGNGPMNDPARHYAKDKSHYFQHGNTCLHGGDIGWQSSVCVAASGADWQNYDLISWDFSSSPGPASNEALISMLTETTGRMLSATPVYRADNAQVSPTNRLPVDPSLGYRLPDDLHPGYQIEASTNLMEWTPLTNAVLYFRDPGSTNYLQRFYRFLKN